MRDILITSKEGLCTSIMFGFSWTLYFSKQNKLMATNKKQKLSRDLPSLPGPSVYMSAATLGIKSCHQINANKCIPSS